MVEFERRRVAAWLAVAAFSLATAVGAASPTPIKEPATVQVEVRPDAVERGGEAGVTVRIVPKSGIKINRYPKIKLVVPAIDGVVGASEVAVGNAKAPPVDQLEANYFKPSVDPVNLTLRIDPSATPGAHEVPARLKYYYCVEASGYCAPAKVSLSIPLTVR